MDAITNLMQNLEISKDSFVEKDLRTKKDFLQKVEFSFKEQNFEQKLSSRITLENVACVYLFKWNISQVMKMYLN